MFKVGDKVICVESNPRGNLHEEQVYTVSNVNWNGGVQVEGTEAKDPACSGFFKERRFKLIEQ